jgi:3-deoxy-D-manno-octulosonate cytidylyltransferase
MITGIIPSRYYSTRFPGKPLIDIHGKSMLQRVYEQCQKSNLDRIVVATDDERIAAHVQAFAGEVILTASTHKSGTDRIAEAANQLDLQDDGIVVNIQGDEPFIHPESNTNCVMVDYRLGYDITEDARISFNIDNIFNTEQSLRPAALSAPRTYSVLLKLLF